MSGTRNLPIRRALIPNRRGNQSQGSRVSPLVIVRSHRLLASCVGRRRGRRGMRGCRTLVQDSNDERASTRVRVRIRCKEEEVGRRKKEQRARE